MWTDRARSRRAWPLRSERRFWNPRGFSAVELLATLAVIAILATLAVPWLLTSLTAFTVSHGAREMRAALNQARTLAITTRQNICVQAAAGGYQFRQGSCGGPAWIGQDTNATGVFKPSSNIVVTGPAPIFTPFGTASQTGSLSVTGYAGGTSTTVTVWPTGRVTIP